MFPIGPLCLTPLRIAEIAQNPLPLAEHRAAAVDRATCTDPDALARDQGFGAGFTETEQTEHFLLAWKADNAALTEEVVATYAEALENSWSQEVDGLGWKAPDQTDACRMTVLLAEFDESWGDTGGYTDVQEARGVPYIILNTAWLEYGDDWTTTLVAHEFNHASQFAYDVFWAEEDWWYWEATAEWIPDTFYDDANTYTWSLWAYLDTPWKALDSMSGTVQYGHFAFNTHLAEGIDADTPRALWAAAGPGDHVSDALEASTGEVFEEVVAAYSSRVASLDVEEQDVWLEALGYFELEPWTLVSELPAEGEVDGREAPQERGQNFLKFSGDVGGDVLFDFKGVAAVEDVPTDWVVTLATVAVGGGVTHEWVYADADGAASLTIEGLGDTVSEAYVAVVPLGEIGEEGAAWSWSAKAPRVREPRPDPVAEEPGACGCASGGLGGGGLGGAGLFGVFAALGAFARVRRR